LAEKEYDARWPTETRPLPQANFNPRAFCFLAPVALAGLITCSCRKRSDQLSRVLTLVSYLFVYTPLKRKTWLNTAVGAIPALWLRYGWTAARNE